MSQWLRNMAQVLEKLDDRAEQAVEEHQQLLEEQQYHHHQRQTMMMLPGGGRAGAPSSTATGGQLGAIDHPTDDSEDPIASILAARGLAVPDDDEAEEDDDHANRTYAWGESHSNEEGRRDMIDDPNGGGEEQHEEGASDTGASPSDVEDGADSTRAADEGWGELSFTDATASERHDGGNDKDDDDDENPGPIDSTDEPQAQSVSTGGDEISRSPARAEEDEASPEDVDRSNPGNADENTEDDPLVNDASHLQGERNDESNELPSDPLTVDTAPSAQRNLASSGSSTGRRSLLSAPLVASLTGGTPSAAAAVAANLASTALKSWGGGMSSQGARATSVHEATDAAAIAVGTNLPSSTAAESQQVQDMLAQVQKEARTLRRHVVALNKQLEGAEREVLAQRNELEQAADRMTKDAARHKDEREKERATHQSQVQALRSEHDAALQAQKAKYEALLDESRSQLKAVEQQRRQEGGNRDKELADALDRESQALAQLASVEDERATLLSQIATLQSQQESLGSRLESLSQTAENAFAREREAEERLDEALSTHARQISQRQAREAELERTVSELGAALVAAEKHATGRSDSGEGDPSNAPGGSASAALLRVATVESELESLRSQLFDEQQRNHSLEAELRESSRERNEEALVAQKRQQQHDRRIEELNHTISQLKSELAEVRESVSAAGHRRQGSRGLDRSSDIDSLQSQIQSLSDDVVRHRDKLGSAQSEVSALRSRLSAALERAQSAESALEDAQAMAVAGSNGRGVGASGDDDDDVEPGLARMRTRLHRARQRGGRGGVLGRTHHSNSMRSALKLDGLAPPPHPAAGGGRGGHAGAEAIGRTLDAVDSLLSQSGKVLRSNPVARLFFVAYWLLLHVWTFVAVVFHAHGMEGLHGDFGNNAQHPMATMMMMMNHGPASGKANPLLPNPPRPPPPQLQLPPKGASGADLTVNAGAVPGEKVVQVGGP
jgi:hypothetical protein